MDGDTDMVRETREADERKGEETAEEDGDNITLTQLYQGCCPVDIPVFKWTDIVLTKDQVMKEQKSDKASGMEMYTPINVQVMGPAAKTRFGMGRGKKDDDMPLERYNQKRPQYDTFLDNDTAKMLLKGVFGDDFKNWFVDNWDFLLKGSYLFDDLTTREERLAQLNAYGYLRVPVKKKTAKAQQKHASLKANPFGMRYKLIEHEGAFQSSLLVDDGKGNQRPGVAADITPYSTVQAVATFHIIMGEKNMDVIFLARSVLVKPEVRAANINWGKFGATSTRPPARQVPDEPMGAGSGEGAAAGAGTGAGAAVTATPLAGTPVAGVPYEEQMAAEAAAEAEAEQRRIKLMLV